MVEVDKSEEITIDRGRVDLRQVFSSARASNQPTDFIRTAIQRRWRAGRPR
jgi:hypothetical protein